MRFSKIIYFRYLPLTQKVYEDSYMQQVENAGLQVEYWDLTSLFFNTTFQQEDSSYLVKTIKFESYSSLKKAIKEQDQTSTLYVSTITYAGNVLRLYRMLTRYRCTLSVFGKNIFPLTTKKSGWRRMLPISRSTIAIFLKKINYIKYYDIIFQGGNEGWKGIGLVSRKELRKAKIIEVNSDDYDNYLIKKNNQRIIEGNYILFLDEYLPFHPDTMIMGIKNILPEEYYPQLNRFFDRVEKQFAMPIVIAAHPKALKYKENNYFHGRQVYFGQSAGLSRDAHFVLAHDSTSINYPIAFGVKLHLLTSHNIEQGINCVHQNVMMFANYLQCKWQYMDNEQEAIHIIDQVNQEAYQNYKYDFQCSKSTENRLSENIFIQFLTQPW